ncbi:Predicted thiol-disulfide oxidoreductase YuxK, DCC family [Chitinophaga jiangningensis]|uniref:Predicted thiol-disulfide oxidoreductase YuxK, DCC family n=1 Tax=Chitinophaga jiangningensis TaxID=1419482 RepID=A0A1M7B0C3_9BACT|nr:thiol-disulfide oxidoreductase DCC family protein [Chitinophaga jiangningensis]SHL48394.1 Predicted thiol-disulfide oxidoreductase YuxK, DCC family [Chitinophaga jiangningensis]
MKHGIILFDGVCNFCNASVNYVIRHDNRGYFRFASLQSDTAASLAITWNFSTEGMESFVLLENGKVYTKSTAALRVARRLGFPAKLLYGFIVLPSFLRDGVYTLIARNRYRWFGRQEACMVPTPELSARFMK